MVSQITSITSVYSTVYSGIDQRKHQSSASLAFVWGIHRWLVNSPHKWPVTRRMFPFDGVIMNRLYSSNISAYKDIQGCQTFSACRFFTVCTCTLKNTNFFIMYWNFQLWLSLFVKWKLIDPFTETFSHHGMACIASNTMEYIFSCCIHGIFWWATAERTWLLQMVSRYNSWGKPLFNPRHAEFS